MYDPVLTGQDASLSARFRRHIATDAECVDAGSAARGARSSADSLGRAGGRLGGHVGRGLGLEGGGVDGEGSAAAVEARVFVGAGGGPGGARSEEAGGGERAAAGKGVEGSATRLLPDMR